MKYNIKIGNSNQDENHNIINIDKLTVPTGDLPYFVEFKFDDADDSLKTILNFGNMGERIIDYNGSEGWVISYGQKSGRIYQVKLPADKINRPRTNIKNFIKTVRNDNVPSRFNNNLLFGSNLFKTVLARIGSNFGLNHQAPCS